MAAGATGGRVRTSLKRAKNPLPPLGQAGVFGSITAWTDAPDSPLPNENVLGGCRTKQRNVNEKKFRIVSSVSPAVDGGDPLGLNTFVKMPRLTKPPGMLAFAVWLMNSNPPVPRGPGPAPLPPPPSPSDEHAS